VWLGGLWFFVSLLPVSQIVPHHELVGERFLYLPSVGFCLVAAVLLERLRALRSERFALAAVIVLACAWGGRLVTRNLDYRNDTTFWSSVLRVAPRNARAHVNIGYNHYYRGQAFEAARSIEKGLSIDPNYWTGHYNLGRVYEKLARYSDAIEEYRTELRYYESPDARFNLASLLGRLGRIEEAKREFENLVREHPRHHQGWFYLGVSHEKLGDRQPALESYREALRLCPDFAEAKAKIRSLEGSDARS
jgi:tetratricopeptide (TPR) repeat protein